MTVYAFVFTAGRSFFLSGLLLSLASDLALFTYVMSQGEKTALEKELQEARCQMELEQARYQELEQRREELAKIRHDFNNQLASIAHLVRSGEVGSAQELIDTLAKSINTAENE